MDKLTLISGALFGVADIFAIVSLLLPDWIISDVGGDQRLGLTSACVTLYGRQPICYRPRLHPAWTLTLILIVFGIFCVTCTCILLFLSVYWGPAGRNQLPQARTNTWARWIGFAAMVCFCIAAVIFPSGFPMEEIGGEAYQLPSSHQVGISYIFFVLALWTCVISELFAGKVCMPHF